VNRDPKDTARVEPWMIAAANEIDAKLGLPRFDLAVSLAAEIIAAHYKAVTASGPVLRSPK